MGWTARSVAVVGAIATTAATAAAAFSGGPVARADGSSFMGYLHDHGYSGRYQGGAPVNLERTVMYGLMACADIRNGMSMADQQQRYWVLPEYPLVAEAAQHELCPDTLH